MKDPSSPTEVCPFCGKAFKRLKSHLPHCKMAETKNMTPKTDHRDKSMTANLVPMKRKDTALPVVEKQNLKVKGKSKTEGLKGQVWQEKNISLSQTTQPKVAKAASGKTRTQQNAALTTGDFKKDLLTTTRTCSGVTLARRQCQDLVALTEPKAPVQQALILTHNVERTVPTNVDSPKISYTLQTVKNQENLDGDQVRLLLPEPILERDTVESSVKYIGVRDDFQGQFNEQVHLNQNSVPKSLSGSSKTYVVFDRSTSFSQERVNTQIPGISTTVCNIEGLRTIGNSVEIKMDVISPPKTVQIVDGPLGLQWIPQLYSNYVQLRVVPGRQDQWGPYGRGTKTLEPIGRQTELCMAGCKESMIENQSTAERLMDVRLGELPAWLTNHSFSPKRIPEFMANAWARYYNKYINVKKGGVGGLTMFLAGYCVLSYSWNYDHIKQDRWRKYH